MKTKGTAPRTFIVLFFALTLSCTVKSSQLNNGFHGVSNGNASLHSSPQPTPESANVLCDRLAELKEIPHYPGESTEDPVYNALVNEGEKVIPCLIEKITDTSVIADPRIAPHVQDFTVGDAAVWMLLHITKTEWRPEEMFPNEYARLWKSEGVYAYFAYVESPENRKAFQNWWKQWIQKKMEEDKLSH